MKDAATVNVAAAVSASLQRQLRQQLGQNESISISDDDEAASAAGPLDCMSLRSYNSHFLMVAMNNSKHCRVCQKKLAKMIRALFWPCRTLC